MTIPGNDGVSDGILGQNEFDLERAAICKDLKLLLFPSSLPDYPIYKLGAYYTSWGIPDSEEEDDDDTKFELRASNVKCEYLTDLELPFNDEIPKYPDDIPVFGPIKEGNFFDVISMLSTHGRDYLVRNNGDRVLVESLRGKYLLVCCFFVPVTAHSEAVKVCFDFIHTYSELSLEKPDQFEMVVVVKMRPDWVHDQHAFDHFFSAFPCLAIPFSDSLSRERVCKSLGIELDHHIDWKLTSFLIVDPEQTVLKHDLDQTSFIRDHGASSFPFTDERLTQLETEINELRSRIENSDTPPSLAELLCLNPSDYLRKCDDSDVLVSVSELNQKLVGLYLCDEGHFLTTLDCFHKKCIAKGLEFEIVLVYLPFQGEMQWFQNRINTALAKRRIPWWVLPFKDTVSRRLSQIGRHLADKMIILGPNSTFGDTEGKLLMAHFGAEAYPFTKQSIIDRKLAKLRAMSLESILMVSEESEHNYVVNKDGDRVPIAELLGRNIILYLKSGISGDHVHEQLIDWYPKLKAKDPDFEVVFVPYDEDTDSGKIDGRFDGMPWLAFPSSSGCYGRVVDQLFLEWEEFDDYPTLIAFGKDGRIRSRHAQLHLDVDGVDAFPFSDHLCQEIAAPLNELKCYNELCWA